MWMPYSWTFSCMTLAPQKLTRQLFCHGTVRIWPRAPVRFGALLLQKWIVFNNLASVVQKVDNAVHRINYYPAELIEYAVDSQQSGSLSVPVPRRACLLAIQWIALSTLRTTGAWGIKKEKVLEKKSCKILCISKTCILKLQQLC